MTSNRRVKMTVTGKMLAGVFASHPMREVISDMPLDAEVVGVYPEEGRAGVFSLIVESSEFDEVPESGFYPAWYPTMTAKTLVIQQSLLATLERPHVWAGDAEFPVEDAHSYWVTRGGEVEGPICGGRKIGQPALITGILTTGVIGCPDCLEKLKSGGSE